MYVRAKVVAGLVAVGVMGYSTSGTSNPCPTTLTYGGSIPVSPVICKPGMTVINNGKMFAVGSTGSVSIVNDEVVELFFDINSIINNSGGVMYGISVRESVNLIENRGLITQFGQQGEDVWIPGGGWVAKGVNSFVNSGEIIGAMGLVLGTQGQAYSSFVTNSGTITSTNTDNPLNGPTNSPKVAILFGDGDDTLKILTGSQINGFVMFSGGEDTFDFSDFAGSGTLDVEGLFGENILSGNKIVTWNGENQIMFAERPNTASVSIVSSSVVSEINQVLSDQLANVVPGAGNISALDGSSEDTSALGYAPDTPQSSAQKAMRPVFDTGALPQSNDRFAWAKIFGGASRDTAPTDMFSYFGGALAGSYKLLDNQTTVGVFTGVAASKSVLISGTQRTTSLTGIVGLYGQYKVGVIILDASLMGGVTGQDSERDIVTGIGTETARGVFASWFLSPSIGINVPVLTAKDGSISIAANVSYTGGNVMGYTETGSSQNLVVGDTPIGIVDIKLGFEGEIAVQQTTYGAIKMSGSVGGLMQSNLGGSTTSVALPGASAQDIATPGTTSFGVYAGIGISVPVSDRLTFGADVDASIREGGYYAIAGSASVLGAF